jgi:LuxR family maltose regulon positive regulatory protein
MNLTKLLPPKPSHILERDRLITTLKSWEDRKLVIIHAQAGQGKSTLAVDYLRSLRSPWIWYNMDREDDNPTVFLSCLGNAVQRVFPQIVQGLPLVPLYRLGIGSTQQGITRWIDQVLGNLPPPLLIVLDDFNNTSPSPELRSLMKILIEYTPQHIRFMLLSRFRPDIELARLRAKQAVGEVTGDDLKFSDAETHELFNAVFGLLLPESESSVINRVTEGWPAGLVLMHEYLAVVPEPERRKEALLDKGIETFRAQVFDYLAQEVFSNLSRDLQRFLIRTSISDDLPVDLMEKLSGLSGPKKRISTAVRGIIGDLRHRNLFVTTVDDEGSVIRYHALFREFLQRKLIALTDPAEVRNLYTLAASYFKSHGDFVRMVDLLISSGQFQPAVRQIESRGLELIARGQIQTLLKWVQALPLDCGNRPWFLFYRAISLRFSDARSALNFFDLAFKRFRSARRTRDGALGQIFSLSGLIEACFYAGGDFKRMAKAAATAAALLKRQKSTSLEARGRLALAIGMAFLFIGRLRQGAEYLKRALEMFRKEGDHYYHIQSASYLAACSGYLCDFAAARWAISRGFEAVQSIPHEPGGDAGLHMAQAMTALFEGRFAEAQESVNRSLSLSQMHALEAMNLLSLDISGWLKIAVGDYDAAEGFLKKCRDKGEEHENAFFTASSAHLLAVLYLQQEKLDRAEAEAEYALSVRARSGSRLFQGASLAVCGAVDVKRGRMSRGERRLLEARRISKECEAAQQEANVLLALADLNMRMKREKRALLFLAEGLRIGEKRKFMYYYLFSSSELASFARTALRHGIEKDFCTSLLNKYDQPESAPRLEIFCFNGFSVLRNGEKIKDAEWKGKQAKTLLKRLVAEPDQKCPRDVVMDMLWPDSSPEAQRANLASLLYRMRKVLDAPGASVGAESCIVSDADHVALNASLVSADVNQFLMHLGKAGRLKSGDPERGIEEYEKAFNLYQGDFLHDDLYNDWAAAARDHLRTHYFKALKDMAKTSESMGNGAKAVEAYAKQFQGDECNEEACRRLMFYHLAAGSKNEALRTYERCQLALRRDLDMEPEEQTKKLYRSIIGG